MDPIVETLLGEPKTCKMRLNGALSLKGSSLLTSIEHSLSVLKAGVFCWR